jgi:predicted HNH restriction endonuclease
LRCLWSFANGNFKRLLRALGYLSSNRSPEVEEQIQMYADSLYNRMLEQEKEIEAAKNEGRPIPVFQPLVPQNNGAPAPEPNEQMKKLWEKRLEGVSEAERITEEAALRSELQVKTNVARQVKQIRDDQAIEREARKAEGKTTLMDQISGLFGGK